MSVRLTPKGEFWVAVVTDVTGLLILIGLMILALSFIVPNGFAPVDKPTRVSDLVLAPCVTEDAPGPCFWDAQNRGNGLGKSFIVDKHGTLIYE